MAAAYCSAGTPRERRASDDDDDEEAREKNVARRPDRCSNNDVVRHKRKGGQEREIVSYEDSVSLAPVPAGHSDAFERFLAAALAALLTVLLSWRFLIWRRDARAPSPPRRLNFDRDSRALINVTQRCATLHCDVRARRLDKRRRRRFFDETLAPKRRATSNRARLEDELSRGFPDGYDLTDSENRVRTTGASSTNENEISEVNAIYDGTVYDYYYCCADDNCRSARADALVESEWPTTDAEDERFIARRYVMENFRCDDEEEEEQQHCEDCGSEDSDEENQRYGAHTLYEQGRPLSGGLCVDMIPGLLPSHIVRQIRDDSLSEHSASSASVAQSDRHSPTRIPGSSSRRPLVSPPCPPSSAMVETKIKLQTDLDENDFLGCDLPVDFMPAKCPTSVGLLCKETMVDDDECILVDDDDDEAELLLKRHKQQQPDIVRDLDTITEVSETDDLTSLSSSGRSMNSKSPRENGNNGKCTEATSKSNSPSLPTKIHNCRLLQYADLARSCEAPVRNADQSDSSTARARDSPEKSRAALLLTETGTSLTQDHKRLRNEAACLSSAEVDACRSIDETQPVARDSESDDERPAAKNASGDANACVGDDFDSVSTSDTNSSGRTSVATDLPVDEQQKPFIVEAVSEDAKPTENEAISSRVDDDVFLEQSAGLLSSYESTKNDEKLCASPSTIFLNVAFENPKTGSYKTDEELEEKNEEARDKETKNVAEESLLRVDSPVDTESTKKNERFLLAYKQYHSVDGDEFTVHQSALSVAECELLQNGHCANGMDQIDLKRALQRFARYGRVYGDAPQSGMEEFGGGDRDELRVDSNVSFMSETESKVSSLPNGNKMEFLLKSTLINVDTSLKKAAASANANGTNNANGGEGMGAVHALAYASPPVSTTSQAAASVSENKIKEKQLNSEKMRFEKEETGPALVDGSSRKTTTTASSLLSSPSRSYSDYEFRSGRRIIPLAPQDVVAAVNSNPQNSVLVNGSKNSAVRVVEKKGRPTSAPLTVSTSLLLSPYSADVDSPMDTVCVASATSQAIVNDLTDTKSSRYSPRRDRSSQKILAEASANAVASNPYVALARATTAAASKVAAASNDNLLDGEAGTVSLVVSSTVTTTKRDLLSTTKSNPDLVFLSSTDYYDEHSTMSPTEQRRIGSVRQAHSSRRSTPTHAQPSSLQQQQPAIVATPTYGVIPRGTASIFQQRHRQLSPVAARRSTTPEKSHKTDYKYANGASGGTHNQQRQQQQTRIEKIEKIRSPDSITRDKDYHKKLPAPYLSSEHLQKMLDDSYRTKSPPPRQTQKPAATSSPTEQVKSPAHKHQLPLSERNVIDWSRRPENSLQNQKQQNLMRWRNSMNLAENEELQRLLLEEEEQERARQRQLLNESMASSSYDSKSKTSLRPTTPVNPDLWDYKLFREEQKRMETEADEEAKSTRRNKYKAKIEKAKKDYLSTKASASDLYRSIEDFERKFNVSMEHVRLPDPPRGPYLEYLSRSGHLHIEPMDVQPAYVRPKPKYDREYESIVRKAEESWAAYKRRLERSSNKGDLYARSRAYSTGVLETDVDDDKESVLQKSIVETDLDQVQREIEHESRRRTKYVQSGYGKVDPQPSAQSRAKSADYLMDRRARTEIEPPENQLKKILGDKEDKDLSEHELRFRKSIEKLHVPDWYLNSEYCPGGKVPDTKRRTPTSSPPAERPKSTQSYHHTNYDSAYKRPGAQTPTGLETQPKINDTYQTRYVSPWTYGGRISGPGGLKSPGELKPSVQSPGSSVKKPVKQEHQTVSEMRSTFMSYTESRTETPQKNTPPKSSPTKSAPTKKTTRDDFMLPRHFFDKYKEEIEELRKSRTALQHADSDEDDYDTHKRHISAQGVSVPVATVRPNQARDEDFEEQPTSSFSFSSSSSPAQRSGRVQMQKPSPAPRVVQQQPYRSSPMQTSTPYSSDQLPRKPNNINTAAAFQPYQPKQQPTPSAAAMNREDSLNRNRQQQPQQLAATNGANGYSTRHMPGGWTVSSVPPDWNLPGQRDSVVIEVAGDALFEDTPGNKNRRLASQKTLDEVLDSMLALSGAHPLTTIDESSSSLLNDTQVLPPRPRTPTNLEGPGIYTQNQGLMEKCLLTPDVAEDLLKRETLWVKCGYCSRVCEMSEARAQGYVSCHHCYTYYCNRSCRRNDWSRHVDICSYARINTLCKQVILKARQDEESQYQMSRVARHEYQSRGRGSVNFRFFSPALAKRYIQDVNGGWKALRVPPNDVADFLRYYTVPDLIDLQKDPNLIGLCRRYDPRAKFVLSVSIMAEIERCPETPPSEIESDQWSNGADDQMSWYQPRVTVRGVSPGAGRPLPLTDTEASWMRDSKRSTPAQTPQQKQRPQQLQQPYAQQMQQQKHQEKPVATSTILKSVLKSIENIDASKDDTYYYQQQQQQRLAQMDPFSRSNQHRHTVSSAQQKQHQKDSRDNNAYWQQYRQQSVGQPTLLIGPEDADETEV